MDSSPAEVTARILIVEDERIVARDIQATLRRLGYDVPAIASSYETALEKAAELRPQLVLQDINIGGTHDGIETALQLRAQFDIPVIFLTAYSDDETLSRAKTALPYGFLLKPFEERELVAAIEMAFYKHDAENRLRAGEARLRRSEAHLSSTLRSIGDGVVAVNLEGEITFINPLAETLTGWKREESEVLKFDEVFRLLDGQTRDPLPSPVSGVRKSAETAFSMQNTLLVARDETEKYVDFNAAPMFEGDEVCGVVVAFRDISERKVLEERLVYQAFHDPLTGLPNRALFSNRLRHALDTITRTHGEVAILFIDMDNFKVVNDSLGHPIGDLMLVEISHRLLRALRVSDTASRFGGDEFTILLEPATDALALAERLVQILQEPFNLENQAVFSSPSIGVAFSDGTQTPDELLRNADVAMYSAKRSGRACYAVYEEGLSEASLLRLQLGNDLRHALFNDELELYYQPKIDLQTGTICGVEALARWNHPQRGMVSPLEFVPLAEEIGLAAQLGNWVLRRACEQAQNWQNLSSGAALSLSVNVSANQLQKPRETDAKDAVRINVNLSVRQLKHPNLVEDVKTILRETNLSPSRLTLEITEDVLMETAESTLVVLNALKALGVGLAIDDFGTGYSNLSYLKAFPLDVLKIDRRFVSGLKKDSTDTPILRSMIDLAHALELQVIAEGAETHEEVSLLRDYGCDVVQGYYISRPICANDFEDFFKNYDGKSGGAELKAP